MSKSDVAVLLALLAALASALGGVVRQRSAQEITDDPVGPLELFRLSLRDSRWWIGGGGAVANYGLQAGALALGSVMLVSALQMTALLFALPIYAWLASHRVSRREWLWAALLAGAVAIVLTVGGPTAGQSRASAETWTVVAAVMGPMLVLCVLGARIFSGPVAAVLLALVSGSSMALFAVLTKGVVEVLKHGVVTALRTPEFYAWLAIALVGMIFQQAAFRAGSMSASYPTMTVAKPVVAWLLGITVLGETLNADGAGLFVLAAAVVLTIVATTALARDEAVAVEHNAEPQVQLADEGRPLTAPVAPN
ncbi:MAG: DMT family transporter [Mycobacterium sp.]|nr:DMT family transporter [Mycobacterium sp.]